VAGWLLGRKEEGALRKSGKSLGKQECWVRVCLWERESCGESCAPAFSLSVCLLCNGPQQLQPKTCPHYIPLIFNYEGKSLERQSP
jgi:hypothetical protein